MRDPVSLDRAQQQRLLDALSKKCGMMVIPLAVIAVDRVHCHALMDVGQNDPCDTFGRAKQYAYHQLGDEIPGKLWGASSSPLEIRDQRHFANVLNYIADHANEGAIVWLNSEYVRFRRV